MVLVVHDHLKKFFISQQKAEIVMEREAGNFVSFEKHRLAK